PETPLWSLVCRDALAQREEQAQEQQLRVPALELARQHDSPAQTQQTRDADEHENLHSRVRAQPVRCHAAGRSARATPPCSRTPPGVVRCERVWLPFLLYLLTFIKATKKHIRHKLSICAFCASLWRSFASPRWLRFRLLLP